MPIVPHRARWLGVIWPLLCVYAQVAVFALAFSTAGSSVQNALAYAALIGLLFFLITIVAFFQDADPGNRPDCLYDNDAVNIAAAAMLGLSAAPLLAIAGIDGGTARIQFVALLLFIWVALLLARKVVRILRMHHQIGAFAQPWFARTMLLPASLLCAFVVFRQFPPDNPQDFSPPAIITLVVLSLVYLWLTAMQWPEATKRLGEQGPEKASPSSV
jgi:hypothetical protein